MGSVNKRREIRLKREQKRRIVEVSLLIFSVLFLGGMLSAVLRVETVDFPNPMLKQAVRAKLGPGIITKTSVSKIRRMDMSNGGHEDLAGIESLWNMRRLNLSHNYVRDLTPLSGLQHITELDLSYNNVYNLEGLQGLVNLEKLNLEGNIVRDLTPLKDLPKLRELNLNYNDITSLEDVNIDALAGSPLRILRLRDNYRIEEDGTIIHLNDVSGVQGLHDLWRLDLRFNQVQDITPIAKLNGLGMLDMRENGLTDISDLAKIKTLRKLNLRGNEIRDIGPLRDLKNLTYLNLHSNIEIASIEPIKGLVEMDTLIVCNIPIGEDFSHVSGMHKLRRINFRNCGVTNPQFLIDLMAKGTLQDGEKKKDRVEIDLQYNGLEYTDLAQYRQLRDYWDNVSLKAPFALPRPMNDLTVTLSHPSGFYEEEFDLVITCDDPNARILYTLDGSEPDVDNIGGGGKPYYVNYYNPRSWKPSEMFGPPLRERWNETYEYMGPIRIKDRGSEPNDLSEIVTAYQTGRKRQWQMPENNIEKCNVLQVTVFHEEKYSDTISSTYFISKNGSHSLPVLSIITDPSNLFEFNGGIYVPGRNYFEAGGTQDKALPGMTAFIKPNFGQRGKYWERSAVLEYVDRQNKSDSHISRMRIHGFGSRKNPHKSLKFYFSPVDQIIGNSDFIDENQKYFDNVSSIILRTGGHEADYLRDIACQSIIEPLNIGTLRWQAVSQFVNGEYWGLAYIRDRFDEQYIINQYEVDKDNIIILKEANELIRTNEKINVGYLSDRQFYNDIHRYVRTNDLSDDENYDHLCELIDMQSYIDYNLAFMYLANVDWSERKHFRLWRSRESINNEYSDGKWRYLVWDFDEGLKHLRWLNTDLLDFVLNKTENQFKENDAYNGNTDLFYHLSKNKQFRKQFVERAMFLLGTCFHADQVIKIIDDSYNKISGELIRHEKRWGDPATSRKNVKDMRKFAEDRPEVFMKHLRKHFPEQFD